MALSPYLSMISLTANRLNSPIKKHRVAECIKNKIRLYAANKRLISDLSILRQKVKSCKKISNANGNQKKAQVAILIPEK